MYMYALEGSNSNFNIKKTNLRDPVELLPTRLDFSIQGGGGVRKHSVLFMAYCYLYRSTNCFKNAVCIAT